MASNVAHPVKLSLFIMFVISMPLYRYWICHQSLGIYLSRSISLLTAVISFLICTFPFFYYVWFHIFDIPYAFSLNYFMFTSTNLLLIWGHLVWFVLHHYFYLIVFFWFSSSLFFHCLYFLWTIFNSFHSPPNFHEGNLSTSSPLMMVYFHSFCLPSFSSSSFSSCSGALQSLSLYDQLQAGRTVFLCDWKDRKYAVGSCSC